MELLKLSQVLIKQGTVGFLWDFCGAEVQANNLEYVTPNIHFA